MTTLDDPGVKALLDKPNHAVVSTLGEDGTIHSTVVWVSVEDGRLAVNSAVGRKWPTNLERQPTITVLVYDEDNPYDYVEVRGTARGTTDGAVREQHLDLDGRVAAGVQDLAGLQGVDECHGCSLVRS